MGILSRCKDILEANVNALLDKAENPEKMIDQMLRKSREDLAKVKEETAGVMAKETEAKRLLDKCASEIATHENAARNALMSGNEEDAKLIIEKKQVLEKNRAEYQTNYEVAHANSERLRQMFNKLTSDISLLEGRAATIKAKAATAKAQEHMNKLTAGIDTSHSLEAFDRMEAKVNQKLDKANAMQELNQKGSEADDLVKQYSGATQASVSDELARMKAEMGL